MQQSTDVDKHRWHLRHLLSTRLELRSGGEAFADVQTHLHGQIVRRRTATDHRHAAIESVLQSLERCCCCFRLHHRTHLEAVVASQLFGVKCRTGERVMAQFSGGAQQRCALREQSVVLRLQSDRLDQLRVSGVLIWCQFCNGAIREGGQCLSVSESAPSECRL